MTSATVEIGTLIERTPGVVGGRPRIAGTRMPVASIAMLWQQGYSAEDVVDRVYTHLDLAQVHAALAYYFANREEVDRRILEDDIYGKEAEAEHLRNLSNAPHLENAERERRITDLEREVALLRPRLS